MIKVEIKTNGSLFHYAHFICDCLLPEINAKVYEQDKVIRLKTVNQTIGNFSNIYEEVMGVKYEEILPKKYASIDCEKIILRKKGNRTSKGEIDFFRKYIFDKFDIKKDRSYPEILLIQRGERRELISDNYLKNFNTNITTGKERREIFGIEELKVFIEDNYPNISKTLILEDLSFKKQVKYFHNAKLVIGMHGAAFANLFFCDPGTNVIEVNGEEESNFFDYISKLNNLNHIKIENNLEEIKKKILLFTNMRKMDKNDVFDFLISEVQKKRFEVSVNKTTLNVPSIFYLGMEKSGSKSILFGFPEHKVAHWHSVHYFEEKYETNLLSSNNLDLYDFAIYIGKKYNFKPLIIECIREPVAQIISAIMQHSKKNNKSNCGCEYCKCFGENAEFLKLVKKNITRDNWINYKTRGFQSLSMWKKHFNIDLLKVFMKKNCYYDLPDCKILLLRLEDSEKRDKLFEKIGYKYVETFSNKTEDNDRVSRVYNYVKNKIKFTRDELEEIYSNEVSIFYKNDEIDKFKEKWLKL